MSNSQNPSQSDNSAYSASSYDPNTYYNYYQAQYSHQNYPPADYSHTATQESSSYSNDSQRQYQSSYEQYGSSSHHSQSNYDDSHGYGHDKSEDSSRGYQDRGGRGRGGFRGGRGGSRGGHHSDSSGGSYSAPVDTIYISGLPNNITEDDLSERFGSIGVIKTDKKTRKLKIYIYKDKETGIPKGDATVTYDDPQTCQAAIEWFDGKEFKGSTLHIEIAQQRDSFAKGGRGGRGGGGFNNKGSGPAKGGDWNCASCGNLNWGWRSSCNKCSAPKPADSGSSSSSSSASTEESYHHNRDSQASRGSSSSSSYGMKDGDWVCPNPSCAAVNFARRSNCHKCNTPKPSGSGSSSGSRDSGRDDRRSRDSGRDDRDRDRHRDRHDDYDRRDSGRDRISDDRRDRRDRPY